MIGWFMLHGIDPIHRAWLWLVSPYKVVLPDGSEINFGRFGRKQWQAYVALTGAKR